MSDPFRIDGPACISFSGGRTSGYMLRRILDAHGGAMPTDVPVLFQNTGKERPETLDFVRECGERWSVAIVWLEYAGDAAFREVTYASASRNGEPFDLLIDDRGRLPNPINRLCTIELKLRVMRDYMRSHGFDHWDNVIGLRADEPNRVRRALEPKRERWENLCPLASARVGVGDVTAFWSSQPFDLRLRPWEGNCDLCFLKSTSKRERIIEDRPDLAAWWVAAEARDGHPFRIDVANYKTLVARVGHRLPMLFNSDPTDLGDCACTD